MSQSLRSSRLTYCGTVRMPGSVTSSPSPNLDTFISLVFTIYLASTVLLSLPTHPSQPIRHPYLHIPFLPSSTLVPAPHNHNAPPHHPPAPPPENPHHPHRHLRNPLLPLLLSFHTNLHPRPRAPAQRAEPSTHKTTAAGAQADRGVWRGDLHEPKGRGGFCEGGGGGG